MVVETRPPRHACNRQQVHRESGAVAPAALLRCSRLPQGVPHMYVGLREASFRAVGSACSAEAGKNGYRFGFWSTTPISAKRRHAAAQNGLVRGLARRQRSGHLQ